MPDLTITRDELVEIVDRAAEGITASTRARLLKVAETTDAVAAGWWHCDGVGCVSRQARRKNQTFQMAYDKAIAGRFGVVFDGTGHTGVVVRVIPAETPEDRS